MKLKMIATIMMMLRILMMMKKIMIMTSKRKTPIKLAVTHILVSVCFLCPVLDQNEGYNMMTIVDFFLTTSLTTLKTLSFP